MFHPKCAPLELSHLLFADDVMIFTMPSKGVATSILLLWRSLLKSMVFHAIYNSQLFFGGVQEGG